MVFIFVKTDDLGGFYFEVLAKVIFNSEEEKIFVF